MEFRPTLEDCTWIAVFVICLISVGLCLGLVFGCGPIKKISIPIPPTPIVETINPPSEPDPPPDPKPKPIISVKGPTIVYDLARCINVPPQIECWHTTDGSGNVFCDTECGEITCMPGEWILCPSGLCYTADP